MISTQGLGLFAARDIEKQTMVIEYNGTVLRNEVAIRKAKVYRSQVKTKKNNYIIKPHFCLNL